MLRGENHATATLPGLFEKMPKPILRWTNSTAEQVFYIKKKAGPQLRTLTVSAVINNINVYPQASRQMLQPDGSTDRNKKYTFNNVVRLYRVNSAHSLMVTKPV